jgi:hypothetical protein
MLQVLHHNLVVNRLSPSTALTVDNEIVETCRCPLIVSIERSTPFTTKMMNFPVSMGPNVGKIEPSQQANSAAHAREAETTPHIIQTSLSLKDHT